MVDLATLQHVKVASGGSRGENITTTDDGRVLLSQSHQIDIFNPVIAPKVAATNPAPNAIVALPQGTISVTFDSDMFAGSANDTTSVLNPANFEVVSASGTITPQSVRYDAKTRTVLLDFNTLTPDHYELRVSPNLKSTAGAELTDGYREQFTAVSDFSALVDFKFTNPRSDRQHQTISYDVILTSKASSDLLLPVMLLLDPAQSFTGVPTDATRNASGAYMVDLKDNLPQGVLKPGQSTTAHTITVYNPDALRVEFTPGIYALPYPNQSPIITSAPVLTAYSSQSYTYQVAANDPDGAVLGYLLYDAPEGMSVDQNSGLITWSPTQQSPVSTDVTLQVYDLRGAHTTQSFTLNVVGGNHKPIFNTPVISGGTISSPTPPLLLKGAEGKPLQIKVQATDSDRNQLRYWADNLPNGAIFDSATGILTWTPGYEAAGTYENVQFTVSDGIEKVVQSATILIAPTNQAPTLIRPANTIVREGEKIRIQLQATDADITSPPSSLPTSDFRLPTSHLTYNSNLLPGGSQLDPRTGLFEWTPAYFQAGEFEIPFTVSDGESITTQTTKITVLNVNAAPVFDNLGAWQIQEGQSVRFRAFALDPDNPGFVPQDRNADGQLTILEGSDPSVTYTVSGLPTGATFDRETAMFAWTPGYANAGTYNVTFTATDDGNGTAATKETSLIVPITVFNTNRAPQISEFTNVTLNRGETRELVLRVSDADNDPLVLQLKAESTGYSIPDFVKFTDNGDGTATLHLTPGVSDGGDYSFTLTAADSGDGGGVNAVQQDEYTFVVSVNAPNDAPKLPFIGNKVAVVGETLEFLVKASDRNQDNLNFNLSGLPVGATLTPTAIYGEALFRWTPTLADIRTYPVTIGVKDSGNGNSSEVLTSQQAFNLVVRTSNTAPILSAIANQTVAEGQTLTKTLSSSDADGDTLTYSASNLPPGAILDSAQGILSWTPTLSQAGTYNNIIVTASDGNKSSSQTFAILVNNTNQAPVLAPLPIQTGQENNLVQFSLAAGDIDNDSLIYSAVSPLPTGAVFDPRTGQFTWKPNYEQAGEYILRFAATDAQGATDIRDVTLRIANVNRTPAISVSTHAVALGETLQFTVAGTDPDRNTNLNYTAVDLPLGAVLDAATGQFNWTPNPGQVGDYAVTYAVTDGEKTVTQTSLVRVAVAPTVPTVTFDLTPSFPAVTGQKVIVQTLANGLAAITNITATVDGRPVTVDSQGRIEIIPTTPGRLVVDVTATDADGRVGHNSTVVKVRDLQDSTAPVVTFAPGLDGAKLTSITNIIGSVNDSNLDSWVLSVADFGENVYRTLASGNGAVSDRTLAQFDPGILENGFYQLRLQATDISDRTSNTQAIVEVNTTTRPSAYTRTQTDLSFTFSSSPTLFSLVRTYSSLNTDEVGSFGNGWQLASLDTNIQTNVPLTGRESLGVYEPFRVGTRLYLTTPTGERVGFTFAPQKHTIPGLTYYTPSWVADSGVNYQLESAEAKLTLAGNRLYDLKTGHAYNPGSGEFDGADYTLSSADGTVYHLSSAGGVTEQIGVNGTHLIYSDSGITSSTGETVRFVKDDAGRLTQITAPDGSLVVYSYDTQGNLVSARNLASGESHRYGYSSNLLTLATGTPGTGGEAITYSATPQVSPVLADLGSAAQFTGKTTNDSLGESDRFTFSLRDSELRSTATGTVLLGVELQGNMALPTLLGLTPVATHLDASGSYALFAVNRAGLNLIELSPSPHLPTSLSLFVAGDVNRDGNVDGVDSGLLEGAIASGNYNSTYDFNRDGVINATDVQILGSNYGFSANRAPVVTSTSVLTHSDLSTSVALDKLATDAEGDAIFYRIINPVNGAVTFTPDGHSAFFLPTAGYSGTASFDVVADDGFSSSVPAKVTVNVSNAALVNLDFARRGLRLDVGGSTELVVVGDFADQQDVLLASDYLQFGSDNTAVASVSNTGHVTGLTDGVSVLSASSHGIMAVTALRVGILSDPTTQDQLNVATAEDYGLDLYPHAVTLPVGVDRRLLVRLNAEDDSPQLQAAANGTRYFVSNPNVISVTPDGVITSLHNGVANVTVVYGGAEAVVPVQVESPHLGATTLGTEGGVVEGTDGSMVMLGQGALSHDANVNITSLKPIL
ncbi:putative Ig domain-containing protein [Nostoc sp.]|uniref:putative Ig domain-containing protein n=1 Tax=Nostoc sp. TaxID=1180 RepID=UPI002FFC3429